jgi:hypothetical protein
MASIKSIRTKNIQCHDEVILDDLPSTGIITILGENSDGKSSMTRAFAALISGSLEQLSVRRSLVNWDHDWGEIELIRDDGVSLSAHIAVENRDTTITLTGVDGTQYTRHLRDGGYLDLVAEFGLHWDKDNDISLNLYETFDPLMFVNTTAKVNAAMLSYCLSDPKVERSIESQKAFVEGIEGDVQQHLSEQLSIRAQLSNIVIYDLNVETDYMQKFEFCERNMSALLGADVELPVTPDYERFKSPDLEIIRGMMGGLAKAPDVPEYSKRPFVDMEKINRYVGYLARPADIESTDPAPLIDVSKLKLLYNFVVGLPEIVAVESAPRRNKNINCLWEAISPATPSDTFAAGEDWVDAMSDVEALLAETCPTCGRGMLSA